MSLIHDRDVTAKLFDDIAPRYTDRQGGYLRILKLGVRPGDGAPWPGSSSSKRRSSVTDAVRFSRATASAGRRRAPG